MRGRYLLGFLCLAALVKSASLEAQDVTLDPFSYMDKGAVARTGVEKLTADERAQLAGWIKAYAKVVQQTANSGDVIETKISGEFKGWDGHSVYIMMNGQIWQQSSYHYHYHYAYSPDVLIFKSDGVFKIKVSGDDDDIVFVKRLK